MRQLSSGRSVFLYQPTPISLKPLADKRLIMLATISLLSGFSSFPGAIQRPAFYLCWNKVHRISYLILPHFAVKCSPWIKEKPLIMLDYQRFSLFLALFL